MKKLFILILMSILGVAAAAAPTNWNAMPPGGSNYFPFDANPGTGKKVQWVVAAGEFSQPTPVGPGNNITSLWFFANGAGNATYNNLTVRLANVSPSTFLGIGAFYSGAMTTVLSQTTTLAPSAAQTWVEIPLTTPFPYDPTQNLIVEVSQCGFTGTGFFLAQQAFGTPPNLRRQYSDSSSACGVTATAGGGDLNVAGIGISFVAAAPLAPTITKSFGTSSIVQNGATTLTITVQNPNLASTLTGVGVSDTFPAGLEVATPNGLVNTCSVAPTAVAGTGVVSLAGATLAPNASCSFTVNVRGTTPGLKNNTTGAVTSTEGGAGSTASASVTVAALVPIPTLNEWLLALLAMALLALAAPRFSRRR